MDNQRKHIISTKKLSAESTSKLEAAGFTVCSYNATTIEYTGTKEIKEAILEHNSPIVFTSKHGVFAAEDLGLMNSDCYSISPVTVEYAENAGFRPKGIARNSAALSELIIANKEVEVVHITTADRREELRKNLDSKNVKLHEYECYAKSPNERKFENFDIVLVFAPSQLDVFLKGNKIDTHKVFCIGKTTAEYAINKGISQVQFCKISSENNLVDFTIQHMTNE